MPERQYEVLGHLDHGAARRIHRADHSVWLWLGIAAILAAVQFFIDPAATSQTAIGRTLAGPIDDMWNGLLAAGGAFIFYGVWSFRPRAEILGHLFLSIAVAINAIAVFTLIGAGFPLASLIGLTIASGFRVWFLIRATAWARQ